MNRVKQEVEHRQWNTYSRPDVSFQIETSLFNEMMARLHDIPEHVRLAILPDAAFTQVFELVAKFLRHEIGPTLEGIHAQGCEVAMQESHITEPFRMTVHYLSDGAMVYVTRKEMLPYA